MNRLSLLKAINLILLLSLSIVFTNCSHNDDDNTTLPSIKASDFKLMISKVDDKPSANQVIIDFDVTNSSKLDYDRTKDGNYAVKFSVKTTDGTLYEKLAFIDSMNAGVTQPDYTFFFYSIGKTLDLSTISTTLIKVN